MQVAQGNLIPYVILTSSFVLPRILSFHSQVNRGYQTKTTVLCKSDVDKTFQQHMINWFYHFTDSIETEAQEKDSLAKLDLYIDEVEKEGKVTPGLITATKTFLDESFTPVLRLLCFREYMYIYCGDVNENCFTESDNASLKGDSMGPAANSKLYNSADAIIQHTGRRTDKLQSKAHSRKRLMPSDSDSVAQRCKVGLSKEVVKEKRDTVIEQFMMSTGKFI